MPFKPNSFFKFNVNHYDFFINLRDLHKIFYTLEEVENDAKSKGAKLIHLDTFDFQAKEFYEKQGYIVFGILENCPEKHYRYYLKKVL